jgi:hypothetical protein
MIRSLLIAMTMLLALSSQAHALTCDEVRQAIRFYGVEGTIRLAKLNGFSDKRIARIKRNCKLERF